MNDARDGNDRDGSGSGTASKQHRLRLELSRPPFVNPEPAFCNTQVCVWSRRRVNSKLFVASSPMRTLSRRSCLLVRWLAASLLPFVAISSAQTALTDADLTAANLAGKTLTFTIQNAQAPLATSGSYSIALNAAGNSFTLTNVTGATVAASGAYSFSNTGFATLTLTNFVAGLEPLVMSLWTVSGTGRFEINRATFTDPGFQTGTFVFGTGSTAITANTAFFNGSFENSPNPGTSSTTLAAGATTLAGWSIASGDIDVVGTAVTQAHGVRGVDLNGTAAGRITQSFTTVAGKTYTVTFDLAGSPGTGVKAITASVLGATSTALATQAYTFDTTATSAASMGWSNKSFTFVADGTAAQIGFLSTTAGANGPLIDNVRLDGATGGVGGLATSSVSAAVGANITLTAPATGSSYQWQRNGTNLAAATSATYALSNLSSDLAGIYATSVSGALNFAVDQFAVIGVATTAKVIGAGSEPFPNILHPNGNTYDQLLINGTATTFTADASQITRMSMVDTQDDIIQIEFSGAGTVTVQLEGSSGPAEAINYVQPGVSYMKGHPTIIVSGADETTNLTVFSVGPVTGQNPTIFRSDVTYDGMADLACIAIHSRNGKFGALRAGNVSFFNTKGMTGVYAPDVQFQGPVYIGDINASDSATPVLVIGSSNDVRITGGDLGQANAASVQVAGFRAIRFTANVTSHNAPQSAKANAATFIENGANVTSMITVSP